MPGNVPVAFGEFPGLDLRNAPDSGGAIDALNVDLTRPGLVRARDGYTLIYTAAASDLESLGRYSRLAYLIAHAGGSTDVLRAIAVNGTVIASQAVGASDSSFVYAEWGSPTASYTYCAGGARTTWYRFDGTAWASVGSMPAARGLTTQPSDNRLVALNIDTTASRVHFSDAGDPSTFGANNYVDLTPGDGQEISGAGVWGNELFVFKRTKFFVFYGNSVDANGDPVFNYRVVDSDAGCISGSLSTRGVASAPEGIYFVGADGIYLTTGGEPVRVSDELTPFFDNTTPASFQGDASTDMTNSTLLWSDRKLYFSFPITGSTRRTFVMNTDTGQWTYWSVPLTSPVVPTVGGTGTNPPVYFIGPTANKIQRLINSATTDDGTAIASRYRTGFDDFGSDYEKEIRETALWGTGTVNFKMSRNYGSLSSAQSVAMGTSPAIAEGRLHKALLNAGNNFSWEIGASSGAWSLQKVVHYLRPDRAGGSKTS